MSQSALFSALRRLMREVLARRGLVEPSVRLRRRQLFSLGAGGAVLAGCTAETAPGDGVPRPITEHVVVVGAGLAGLLCAYRLRQARVQAAVYEGGSRVGGRIYTRRDLFRDDVLVCELGAEFLTSDDETMLALAEELGITPEEVQAAEIAEQQPAPIAGFRERVYWLLGRGVPEATLLDQLDAVTSDMLRSLMAAENDETGRAATELDDTSLGAWLETSVPSADYPELSSLLAAAFRAELGREPEELSAYNLRRLFGKGEIQNSLPLGFPLRIQDRHFHALEGCDQFTQRLADKIDELGEGIKLRSRLIALRGVDGHYVLTFEAPEGAFEVEATHVVLAIPFSTLREVDLSGVDLPADKRALIDELGYGTSCKLVGAFAGRIWNDVHNASGDTLSDGVSQHAWDSSYRSSMATIPATRWLMTTQQGGRRGLESGSRDPDDDFLAVVAELDQVYPPPEGAPTFAGALVEDSALRVHWPSLPLARGSNPCALPGQWQKLEIAGRREGNLHFCGDHCSIDQFGRMEAAARSGELVAEELLEELAVPEQPPSALARVEAPPPPRGRRPSR